MVEIFQIHSPTDISPELYDTFVKLSLNEMGYMTEALQGFRNQTIPCRISYVTVDGVVVSWGIFIYEDLNCFEYKNLFCFTHKLHRRKGYGALAVKALNPSQYRCCVDTSSDNRKSFWSSVLND